LLPDIEIEMILNQSDYLENYRKMKGEGVLGASGVEEEQ
jgi:hypothetical protein